MKTQFVSEEDLRNIAETAQIQILGEKLGTPNRGDQDERVATAATQLLNELIGQRLQSSPAPVVGGVPELTDMDIAKGSFDALAANVDSSSPGACLRFGVQYGYRLAASRLSSIKPGGEAGGVEAIAQERRRQIETEGWTPSHDDAHFQGELAAAARCYAMEPGDDPDEQDLPEEWPWDPEWWKPTPHDRRRELAKAGALIAAEIDRLDRLDALRAQATTPEGGPYA